MSDRTRRPGQRFTRRDFVKASAAAASVAAMGFPTIVPSHVLGADAPSEQLTLGFIGTGSRGTAHVNGLTGKPGVRVLAACDVDAAHLKRAIQTIETKHERVGRPGKCDGYAHYEEVIARKDIDCVVITTPDHWHIKIATEALRAGKDIYCEKPLTLTIDEGKIITRVVKETGKIFQVGTQQRSTRQFLEAIAAVRKGLIGKVKRVVCSIGGGPKGGPFPVIPVPPELDWERWQGQTPAVDYRKDRCHYQFRWWYEYSGGKMTDWGAHHVDIAQWGIGMEDSGPVSVEPIVVEHPVPFKDGMPQQDDSYNTATRFQTRAMFGSGVEMIIRNDAHDFDDPKLRKDRGNGIWFEGDKGDIFVNRNGNTGKLNGERPDVTKEELAKLYKSDEPFDHYGNWLNCVRERRTPVSDVWSHHRILTTCHLANIANRLGKKLEWDPQKQMITNDAALNSWLKREQRKGYEIKA